MYSYNLIIKAGVIDTMDAMVNRQLTRRFGPDVHYHFRSKLSNEAVVIVSHQSQRVLNKVLTDWFLEDLNREAPYPEGSLLHYSEIVKETA